MAEWFKNFVESSTNTKYVPLGSKCTLCDKKLNCLSTGFFSCNAVQLADGAICKTCQEKLMLLLQSKNQCLPLALQEKEPYFSMCVENIFATTQENAKTFLGECEIFCKETIAQQGNCSGMFRIEHINRIKPKATDVGIARAQKLKDKIVLYGYVQAGKFKKGDCIKIVDGMRVIDTKILEAYVYDCEENTLNANLKANMGKQQLNTWQKGWLCLDTETLINNTALVFV